MQDIETLGIESTSVILSNTFLLVNPDELSNDNTEAFFQLCENSITVKFKVKPQLDVGRTTDKSTVEWWKKQTEYAQKISFLPSKNDVDPKIGIRQLRDWYDKIPNSKKLPVWVRGSLDQPCFQSLLRNYSEQEFVSYNAYRDVRTMIELVYPDTAKGGYVEIPDFDTIRHVYKHVPEHDCAYDALMMLRGKV